MPRAECSRAIKEERRADTLIFDAIMPSLLTREAADAFSLMLTIRLPFEMRPYFKKYITAGREFTTSGRVIFFVEAADSDAAISRAARAA